jgi:hypothetical protein
MKTKEEILEIRESIAIKNLKSEYGFIYDHLILAAREELETRMETYVSDELSDISNENIHTECFDGHHRESSTGLDFEDAKKAMDEYAANMATIAEIYEDKA